MTDDIDRLPDTEDAPEVEPDPNPPRSHSDEDESDKLPDEDDVPDAP